MKTLNTALIVAALTVTPLIASDLDQPGMKQRAAYNHYELMKITGPRNTKLPEFAVAPRLGGGKHAMQMAEAYRPASNEKSLDVVHAPRPLTSPKDPDFERKWRENAEAIQVAPLK